VAPCHANNLAVAGRLHGGHHFEHARAAARAEVDRGDLAGVGGGDALRRRPEELERRDVAFGEVHDVDVVPDLNPNERGNG
jgi:hypothetical protein